MRYFVLMGVACAIAVAGASVYASEPPISSQSELVGSFGDGDGGVYNDFTEFLEGVSDAGFDFADVHPSDEDVVSVEDGSDHVPDVTVSGNLPFGGIDLYSSYNAYYGSIGTTYVEYMRGFLPKLRFNQHYVASRVGQYDYIFAYGSGLEFDNSVFSGTNITVVHWNTYNNGSFNVTVEDTFSLYPGSYLVYSDLSVIYPTLADLSGFTLRQVLILFVVFGLVLTIDRMYQVRKIRRIGG